MTAASDNPTDSDEQELEEERKFSMSSINRYVFIFQLNIVKIYLIGIYRRKSSIGSAAVPSLDDETRLR